MNAEEKLKRMDEILFDIVKKISKSIECGEYESASFSCRSLEFELSKANKHANFLADRIDHE